MYCCSCLPARYTRKPQPPAASQSVKKLAGALSSTLFDRTMCGRCEHTMEGAGFRRPVLAPILVDSARRPPTLCTALLPAPPFRAGRGRRWCHSPCVAAPQAPPPHSTAAAAAAAAADTPTPGGRRHHRRRQPRVRRGGIRHIHSRHIRRGSRHIHSSGGAAWWWGGDGQAEVARPCMQQVLLAAGCTARRRRRRRAPSRYYLAGEAHRGARRTASARGQACLVSADRFPVFKRAEAWKTQESQLMPCAPAAVERSARELVPRADHNHYDTHRGLIASLPAAAAAAAAAQQGEAPAAVQLAFCPGKRSTPPPHPNAISSQRPQGEQRSSRANEPLWGAV
jgi:hypothetical protein